MIGPESHSPSDAAGPVVAALCLALAGCASVSSYPPAWPALSGTEINCGDVAGEYASKGVDATGGEASLSVLFGLGPGATRVVLYRAQDSMQVTAYYVNAVLRDVSIPITSLSCQSKAVTYEFQTAVAAGYRYEGQPVGDKSSHKIELRKAVDGSLVVHSMTNDTWIAMVNWGELPWFFSEDTWARFDRMKP